MIARLIRLCSRGPAGISPYPKRALQTSARLSGRMDTVPKGLWINNASHPSRDPNKLPDIHLVNPSTGEPIEGALVANGNKHDVDLAVEGSLKALEGEWRTWTGSQRRDALLKIAENLSQNRQKLAYLEALQGGKPVAEAEWDVDEAVECFKHFAGYADKVQGKTISTLPTVRSYTIREPVGLCGVITSFNYPLVLASWKIAPALATGNAIILKPHPSTPLSTLLFATLTSHLPPGILQILPGDIEVGKAIVSHPDIAKISFTGSPEVGKLIGREVAGRLGRVTIEGGGKSAVIIDKHLEGEAFDKAVEESAGAILANIGQNCCAGSRMYIHADVQDRFLAAFKARIQSVKIGDALDEKYNFGPIVNKTQFARVKSYLNIAREEGLQVLCGGKALDGPGFFVEPTVFVNVPETSRLCKEEIFGPVLVVLKPWTDPKDLLSRVLSTPYALAAGVFSTSQPFIDNLIPRLKVGTTWVNMYNTCYPWMPFGGYGLSGFGRDLGEEAVLSEFTEVRSVNVAVGHDMFA